MKPDGSMIGNVFKVILSLVVLATCGVVLWRLLPNQSTEPTRPTPSGPGPVVEQPQPETPPKPDPVDETIKTLNDQIGPVLNVEQVAAGGAYVELKAEKVAKLVTIEMEYKFDDVYSTTWGGSEKKITSYAKYKAYAGVDLASQPPLKVYINAAGDPSVRFTREDLRGLGIIISCEELELKTIEEGGWWNKITDKDRQAANINVKTKARNIAETCGLKERAEDRYYDLLKQKIQDILPLP